MILTSGKLRFHPQSIPIYQQIILVFIHVIQGRPSGLVQFPAGEAVKICFASVSSGIRAMCPNRDRRLDWTMAERWGCWVNLQTLHRHKANDVQIKLLMLQRN